MVDDSVYALRRAHLDRIHLARIRARPFPSRLRTLNFVTGQGDAVLIGGAGIQHAKQHLLPFLHAHRIARAERVTVHGINRVSDFKVAFRRPAIEICFPPMQREKKPPRRLLAGLFLSVQCREIRIVPCTWLVSYPGRRECGCDTSGSRRDAGRTNYRPDSACGHHRRSLLLGTIHLEGQTKPLPMHQFRDFGLVKYSTVIG